jgi:chromosome segregation ATPase
MVDGGTSDVAVRELLARASADRDALLMALDQCRAQLTRLAGRLAMEQARVDDVEQLRAELAKAMRLAQRATTEVESVVKRIEKSPSSDAAVDGVMRELTAVRTSGQRVLDETRTLLEVRIDSLAAGLEAQLGTVRDGLWDRVAELQQAMQATDRGLGDRTQQLEAGLARATDRLASVATDLAAVREAMEHPRAASTPAAWLLGEVTAWVGGLTATLWALGRYAAGVAAGRPA